MMSPHFSEATVKLLDPYSQSSYGVQGVNQMFNVSSRGDSLIWMAIVVAHRMPMTASVVYILELDKLIKFSQISPVYISLFYLKLRPLFM